VRRGGAARYEAVGGQAAHAEPPRTPRTQAPRHPHTHHAPTHLQNVARLARGGALQGARRARGLHKGAWCGRGALAGERGVPAQGTGAKGEGGERAATPGRHAHLVGRGHRPPCAQRDTLLPRAGRCTTCYMRVQVVGRWASAAPPARSSHVPPSLASPCPATIGGLRGKPSGFGEYSSGSREVTAQFQRRESGLHHATPMQQSINHCARARGTGQARGGAWRCP
jgi:hypothetical protein